jgi:hypothetical protein
LCRRECQTGAWRRKPPDGFTLQTGLCDYFHPNGGLRRSAPVFCKSHPFGANEMQIQAVAIMYLEYTEPKKDTQYSDKMLDNPNISC